MKNISLFTSAIVHGMDIVPIIVESTYAQNESNMISIIGTDWSSSTNIRRRVVNCLAHNNIKIWEDRQYIVNLSPSIGSKFCSNVDLPILITLLNQNALLPEDVVSFLEQSIIVGEVSLNGDIRPVPGTLAIAIGLKRTKKLRVIIPKDNVPECSLVPDVEVIGISHIDQLFDLEKLLKQEFVPIIPSDYTSSLDMNQIRGQKEAKRVLEIAAAGEHNIILYGPPGSGKTMLAQRLSTIMPPMTNKEIVEATIIHSIAGTLKEKSVINKRPFRAPHYSIPKAAMIGGGNDIFPGEISLAHGGVMFLDEMLENHFTKLENLRQILEEHEVRLRRASHSVTYPASFLFIGAFNPCPCGYYGSTEKKCSCSFFQIKRYLDNISGPLLDRIDMQIGINAVNISKMEEDIEIPESSETIARRIRKARDIQYERNFKGRTNGHLEGHRVEKGTRIGKEAKAYLLDIYNKLKFSMRSYHKIIRISRTIADLGNSEYIEIPHVQEALMYRSFEKFKERFNAKT